jgi:large subunit ribosomal protein L35
MTPPFRAARRKGHAVSAQNATVAGVQPARSRTGNGDRKMPKMKTKSSAKKRFKFTATGKLKHGQAGKRHGMIKRTNEQIRELRGTSVMSASETQRVRRWMPYSA